MKMINKILQGDSLNILKTIPDESVDCIVTSPPYYGLRNYNVEGQIGLEPTFQEYLDKMIEIMREMKRVLKSTGQIWINFGDCYGSHSIGGGIEGEKAKNNEAYAKAIKAMGTRFDEKGGKISKPHSGRARGLPDKCLLMQPERFAIRCIDELGLILRNKIKWSKQILIFDKQRGKYTKGSVMPTSVKDRFNESGEELYLFVKNKKYYSNLDAVRLPPQTFENRPDGITRAREWGYNSKFRDGDYYRASKFNYRVRDAERKAGQPQFKASEEEIKRYNEIPSDYGKKKKGIEKQGNRWMSGTPRYTYQGKFAGKQDAEGKNLPTIWQINPEPHNFQRELGVEAEHFAVYPEALCEIPIKFGCPKKICKSCGKIV